RLHGAGERGAATRGNMGARGNRGIDLHQIDGARLEGEIALDGHRAGRSPRRENAAAVDRGCAHSADARERGARIHRHRRIGDRAVHEERTAIDGGGARIRVGTSERQRSGAHLHQRAAGGAGAYAIRPGGAAVANNTAHRRVQVIAADRELIEPKKYVPAPSIEPALTFLSPAGPNVPEKSTVPPAL